MKQRIPWSFIRERARLSWSDAALGYKNQWLDWNDVIELACDCLSEGEDTALVLELAGISKAESHLVGELLDKIAQASAVDDPHTSMTKWLYLNLAWLFKNRETVDDPLGEVENIYADFDYPEGIVPFVRYMPVTDGYNPSLHSAAENHARLITNWKSYLERMAAIFNATPDVLETE